MASKHFEGQLLEPIGDAASNDKLRFTHTSTTGQTIGGAQSVVTIDAAGFYSFDLEYGIIQVEYFSETANRWRVVGSVTINSDITATTITALLNAVTPATPELVLELQQILADADQIVVDAQNSADAAAQSAIDAANSAVENGKVIKSILVSEGLSGEYGCFADGFTLNDLGDVGIDASYQFWKYTGAETLPYAVPQGTDPSTGDWELFRFNLASLDTVTAMRTYDYSGLAQDTVIEWGGYYQKGDGGGNKGLLKLGDSTSMVDDGGSIFIIVNDAINGVWIEANTPILASQWGAVYDGVTDFLTGFNYAKLFLSSINEPLVFDKAGTVYISSNRPDLSGVKIKANTDFILKVDQNPNVKDIDLLTDLIIENPVHGTSLIKHRNRANDYLIGAGAALNIDSYSHPEKINYTDFDVELASITGVKTKGAFTGTTTNSIMNWSGGFASGQQGAFVKVEHGAYYEAAFRHVSTALTAPSARRGICVITPTQRIDFSVYVNQAIYTVIDSSAGVLEQGTTPNGGAYALSDFGAVTVGVRVIGLVAEFYVNSTLITTHEMDATPFEIGFITNSGQSEYCQINNITKQSSKVVASSSPTSIAIIGDSISYGAWSSDSYDEIIKKTMTASGLGDVSSVNYGVSGSATNEWLPGGSIDIDTKDLSGSEYTLIMLGTNDVQGSVSGGTFESNIRTLVSRVEAQGSKPILGVFPVFTTSGVSGVTGVSTSNYAKGGWHRQIVKWVAADLGIKVAEVCESFGTNIGLLGDNIHPTEKGQILIASAFAKAIIADKLGKRKAKDLLTQLELQNGWSSVGSSGLPIATLKSGVVNLTGVINSGSVGDVIMTLPNELKPARTKTFVCALTNSGVIGYGHIRIQQGGEVILQYSSEASYDLVWLDCISYTPES